MGVWLVKALETRFPSIRPQRKTKRTTKKKCKTLPPSLPPHSDGGCVAGFLFYSEGIVLGRVRTRARGIRRRLRLDCVRHGCQCVCGCFSRRTDMGWKMDSYRQLDIYHTVYTHTRNAMRKTQSSHSLLARNRPANKENKTASTPRLTMLARPPCLHPAESVSQ